MKFLVDANLSPRVAVLLRAGSLQAEHVRDHDLQAESDEVILEFARVHRYVVISEDTDFGELLARQRAASPSFVLMRTNGPLTPDEHGVLLLANLPALAEELERGAVAVIGRDRIRVRRLPFLTGLPDRRNG